MDKKPTAVLIAWLDELLGETNASDHESLAEEIRNMYAIKDRLAEQEAVIERTRADALEEAAHWIEHNEIWETIGGEVSVKPSNPRDVGSNYRALAAEIRKLKALQPKEAKR